MIRRIFFTIFFIVFSLCNVLYAQKISISSKKGHIIEWLPDRIEETVEISKKYEYIVQFKSKIYLKNVKIWITPSISNFVKSDKEFYSEVKANEIYEVRFSIYPNDNIFPGKYEGTVHLRVGSKTYPETLKFKLTVIQASNQKPVANAGEDIVTVLPDGYTSVEVMLDGSNSYDPDGSIVSYFWSGSPDPDDVVRPVISLKQGIYNFTLTVKDDKSTTSQDDVNVYVLGPPFIMPLPEVIGEESVKIKGIALAGSKVVIINKNSGESKEIIADKGIFISSFSLLPGLNEFTAYCIFSNLKSSEFSFKTYYAPVRNLFIESINPLSGTAGSIVTITGEGFSVDKENLGVYFKGREKEGGYSFESKAVILESTANSIKVLVPFIFFSEEDDLEVYVYDGVNISNSVVFHVLPVHDPTPENVGNEFNKNIDLLLSQIQIIYKKLQSWTKPNVPMDTWVLIEENVLRINIFLEMLKQRLNAIPNSKIKSNLDAIFATEFFSSLNQNLTEINEILSNTTPCDVARVVQILRNIQSTINIINNVIDAIKNTLIVAISFDTFACLLGCIPCCASIPMLYEILSTICTIDSVIDGVSSVFNTVIALLNASIPMVPSEWKILISGPFDGISNQIIYTNTANKLSLYANFTNAGFEQLTNLANLSIEIPDFGIFSLLGPIGQTIKESLEEILGDILFELTVDLLDIDEIRITFADIPVDSTLSYAPGSRQDLLNILNPGISSLYHDIVAGSITGSGTSLNIRAVCGIYQYPDKTKCNRLVNNQCLEWGTDYPQYHTLKVIDKPVINSFEWFYEGYTTYSLKITGEGYSATGYTHAKVDVTPFYPFTIDYTHAKFPSLEIIHGFNGNKPMWLSMVTKAFNKETGEMDIRESDVVFIPASPDLETVMAVHNPEVYPGDNLYVTGNFFCKNLTRLNLLDNDTLIRSILPDYLFYGPFTYLDIFRFSIPMFQKQDFDYDNKNFKVIVKVDDGRPCQSNNCDEGTIKVLHHKSTGYKAYDDQDFMIFGPQIGSYVRTVKIGDINGDGINDLLIGVPGYRDYQGRIIGAIYIILGSIEGDKKQIDNKIFDYVDLGVYYNNWDIQIIGDYRDWDFENSRRIGYSIAIGDVNGDGIDDILIGSRDQNELDKHTYEKQYGENYRHFPGKAYLFYGRRNWNSSYYVWDANVTFIGDDVRELGYEVGIGRISGSSILKDIVITAPTDSVNPDSLNDKVARVYVIKGWGTSSPNPENFKFTYRVPEDFSQDNILIIEGKNYYQSKYVNFSMGEFVYYKGDGMGKALAIGDINGDGLDDIVLGAPQYCRITPPAVPRNQEEGAVYIIYGSPSLNGYRYVYPLDGDQDFSIVGPKIYANDEKTDFGKAVLVADITGDGNGEVIIGAPSAKLNLDIYPSAIINEEVLSIARIDQSNIGKVFIIDGQNVNLQRKYNNEYMVDLIVNGSLVISKFGYSLSSGDINNDGLKDLIVGAPGRGSLNDSYKYQRGNVWVFYGNNDPKWRKISGQDVIHLEVRRWFVDDYDRVGSILPTGSDYLIIGPYEECQEYFCPRFGTFVNAGDLNPYIGDDLLVISPKQSAPVVYYPYQERLESGILHIFYEGTKDLWPLAITPEHVSMYFCNSEQVFTIKGGMKSYRFIWRSCYKIGIAPYHQIICFESLPENFVVEYDENSVLLRLIGCVTDNLMGISLEVIDALSNISISEVDLLKPIISVSALSINFGTVPPKYTVVRTVNIKNVGDGNLIINNIELVGGLDIRFTNYCPYILAPNASCSIDIVYNPKEEGVSNATLVINSNDPNTDLINISITGTCVGEPNLVVIGGNLVFYNVYLGSTQYQDIIVKNSGMADLAINNAYIVGPTQFKIVSDTCTGTILYPPVPPLYIENTCLIRVSFTPEVIAPVYGNIYIKSNDPDTPLFTGWLSGNGQNPALYVNPTSINLGSETNSTSFVITNSEVDCIDNLQWEIVNDLPSWLSVSPMYGSISSCGGSKELTVNVNRTGLLASEYSHVIKISSNGGVKSVEVKMNVPKFIMLSPMTVNFGEAKTREPVTISNTNLYNTILNWEISDNLPSWLSVSHMSGALPAGSSTTIYLNVNREGLLQQQSYTHNLIVNSNGGDVILPVLLYVPIRLLTFAKSYGKYGNEYFTKIKPTNDGGFVAIGTTSSFGTGPYLESEDLWVVKLDSSGYVEWEKTYGGYSYTERAFDVVQTQTGEYVVIGMTKSFTEKYNTLWVLKLDNSGNIIWQKQFEGCITNDLWELERDFSLKLTPNNEIVIAGNTFDLPGNLCGKDWWAGNTDLWIVKMSLDGDVLWQKTYGGSRDDYAKSIEITHDGGFVVGGVTRSFNVEQKPDIWILKLDSNGNTEWEKVFGENGWDLLNDLRITQDNGYIIIGYSEFHGSTIVIKLNEICDIEWQKSYGLWNGYGNAITPLSDGGFIFTGYLYDSLYDADIWVVKLDSLGNIIWQRTYGGNNSDAGFSILELPNNMYILAGWTQSFKQVIGSSDYDAFVMKIDSIGNLGSSCGITDYSLEPFLDINISSFSTISNLYVPTTLTDNTDALVKDSTANVKTVCSETIEQAGQKPLIDIDVFPLFFDFGSCRIGTASWNVFTIINKGYKPIFINNIQLTSNLDFSFNHTCPSVLDIAQRCEVIVTFSPSTIGDKNASLYIESNDPDEGLIEIPITGTGLPIIEFPPEVSFFIAEKNYHLSQSLLYQNRF